MTTSSSCSRTAPASSQPFERPAYRPFTSVLATRACSSSPFRASSHVIPASSEPTTRGAELDTRIGVLLMSFGTAATLDDVPAYLASVRGGTPAPDELAAEFQRRFARVGGSPLTR